MDIEPSARRHGVTDDGMLDAHRPHLVAYAADDDTVTMDIGPS